MNAKLRQINENIVQDLGTPVIRGDIFLDVLVGHIAILASLNDEPTDMTHHGTQIIRIAFRDFAGRRSHRIVFLMLHLEVQIFVKSIVGAHLCEIFRVRTAEIVEVLVCGGLGERIVGLFGNRIQRRRQLDTLRSAFLFVARFLCLVFRRRSLLRLFCGGGLRIVFLRRRFFLFLDGVFGCLDCLFRSFLRHALLFGRNVCFGARILLCRFLLCRNRACHGGLYFLRHLGSFAVHALFSRLFSGFQAGGAFFPVGR